MPEDREFYDNPDARRNYLAHRDYPDNPINTLERPIFLELVGNLTNLDIVDLSCGDATFGQAALLQGARSYIGIDISQAMVDIARQTLANTSGKVTHASIEIWRSQDEQADLVSSRLALNGCVAKLQPVFQEMHKALRPSGRAIISIEHPVITSNFTSLAVGRRTTWLVDNYFKPGARVHTWLGHKVTKLSPHLRRVFGSCYSNGF